MGIYKSVNSAAGKDESYSLPNPTVPARKRDGWFFIFFASIHRSTCCVAVTLSSCWAVVALKYLYWNDLTGELLQEFFFFPQKKIHFFLIWERLGINPLRINGSVCVCVSVCDLIGAEFRIFKFSWFNQWFWVYWEKCTSNFQRAIHHQNYTPFINVCCNICIRNPINKLKRNVAYFKWTANSQIPSPITI